MIGSCIVDVLNELNKMMGYNIKIFILVRNKPLERFITYENTLIIKQDII